MSVVVLADVGAGVAAVADLARQASELGMEVRARAAQVRRAARTDWHAGAADAYEDRTLSTAAQLDRCADLFGELAFDLAQHARVAQERGDQLAELVRRARRVVEDALQGRLAGEA